MKKKIFTTHFSQQKTNKILWLLLIIDLFFILTHVIFIYLIYIRVQFDWSIADLFMINKDQGYPEMFQYLEYLIIIILLIYLLIKKQGVGYISWLLLFALLLLDDSLQFHENFGTWAVEKFNYKPMFGLRAQDIGELTYVALFGTILLFFLVFGYLKGNEKYRKINIDLSILLALFLFFGVIIDMLDQLIVKNRYTKLISILFEDGGEMIMLSLIVWYFFFLILKPIDHNVYLFENFYKKKNKVQQ